MELANLTVLADGEAGEWSQTKDNKKAQLSWNICRMCLPVPGLLVSAQVKPADEKLPQPVPVILKTGHWKQINITE